MTKQSEILSDAKYIPLLDHGFVGLVDHMGSDSAIVQAARVSYGAGTKNVREDRALIRYLMRHKHTSPIEQCEVKLHLKMPIFVFRQFVRHRTASLNEYSGRYSVMTDEFYTPSHEDIAPQASDNKQGRSGEIDDLSKDGVQWLIKAAYDHNYAIYKTLLGPTDGLGKDSVDLPYDPYGTGDDSLLSEDFQGVAREIARVVLPVGNYTELYWKQNLHNMFHLIKLRADSHAQKEIRDYANAIHQLIQPLFPAACEAAEDYLFKALTISRIDTIIVKDAIKHTGGWTGLEKSLGGESEMAKHYNLSPRELRELKLKVGD